MTLYDPDLDGAAGEPERPRWEPIPGESGRSYAAFAVYRGMGVLRTLRKAAGQFYGSDPTTGPQLKQFKRWSSEHAWVERAESWDMHLDEIGRAEQVDAVKEMNGRHAQFALFMQAKASEAMQREGIEFTVPQAIKAFEVAFKAERLARGEADSITAAAQAPADEAFEAKKERALAMADEVAAARERRAVAE